MTTRKKLQLGIYKIINPLVRLLIRAGLTPNMVTTIGLVLNIGVAIIFISGAEEGRRGDLRYVGWAGALILFAGLFDMLDGQVARLGNMSSPFGALYDSVLDRYSELILFLGICYYLVSHHYFLSSLFAFIGLIGSMMVSYTRARAEGLGIECKDGLMQRPERVIIVGVSALACGIASRWLGGNYKIAWPDTNFPVFETISIFTIPVTIMAFLANFTAIGRLRDARRTLQAREATAAANGATAAATSSAGATISTSTTTSPASTNGASNGSGSGPVPAIPIAPRKSSLPGALIILFGVQSFITGLSTRAQPSLTSVHPAPVVRDAVDTFPVPPHNSNSLFYLQRTPNTNTVICELNEKNGVLDEHDPVHVLWIRYGEEKQRQELTFIQRHFAYGLKSRNLGKDVYELHFVSYKNVLFYLKKSPVDNKRYVYATITGKQAILNRIYIKIDPGGTFWSPNVEYLELKGTDIQSGKELIQRIKV
jgi:phosphatidylglycerophosphate synthase